MRCADNDDCECRDCREKRYSRERRRFARDDDSHPNWDEEIDDEGEFTLEAIVEREIAEHCEPERRKQRQEE